MGQKFWRQLIESSLIRGATFTGLDWWNFRDVFRVVKRFNEYSLALTGLLSRMACDTLRTFLFFFTHFIEITLKFWPLQLLAFKYIWLVMRFAWVKGKNWIDVPYINFFFQVARYPSMLHKLGHPSRMSLVITVHWISLFCVSEIVQWVLVS